MNWQDTITLRLQENIDWQDTLTLRLQEQLSEIDELDIFWENSTDEPGLFIDFGKTPYCYTLLAEFDKNPSPDELLDEERRLVEIVKLASKVR